MRAAVSRLGLLLIGSLALAQAGCDEKAYCLDCEDAAANGNGDGGMGDGDGGMGTIDASPFDAAPPPDACAESGGIEICDGLDNDCDMQIDEGSLPGIGVACNETLSPPCTAGTTACVAGEVVCGAGAVNPITEVCDGVDNDCDGTPDDNNPGGGLACGDPTGECQAGVTLCTGGGITCSGQVGPVDESCNGRDDDCNGVVDNGTGGGDCGPANENGACQFGTETCVGGTLQCIGEIMPRPEDCDVAMMSDLDCDGSPTNGFNLQVSVNNCGACGVVCNVDNAFEACAGGDCFVAACQTDYWDNDGTYINGCEFGPCEFQGAEDCNGADDDCDGLTDLDDPSMATPSICASAGECAGTVPTCTAGGWVCTYPGTVSTDAGGQIVPETECDGLDNDCDGDVDEPFPLLELGCDDGQLGSCRDSGVYVCNPAGTGVECDAVDTDGGVGTAETCNGLDDNCSGTIDEGDLNTWVDLGAVEIFAYEASRQNATATSAGSMQNRPCSKADALPWTNITHDQAQAACVALGGGARLCSEAEWASSCTVSNTQVPSDLIALEAESFTTAQTPCSDAWATATTVGGFSGTGYLVAGDNSGDDWTAFTGQAGCASNRNNAIVSASRADRTVNFPAAGTWYVWVNGSAPDSVADTLHIGLDGAGAIEDMGNLPVGSTWAWINDGSVTPTRITVATAGNHTLNLWVREDGARVDRIHLTQIPEYDPRIAQDCDWSFDDDCFAFQANTCNGNDLDTDGNAANGDQDDVLPTGELAACFADWGAAGQVHDLSGNVKEWTAERSAGVNPIRGGASNNTATGISCGFDFLTADDSFQFDNVGFRCCR